MGYYTFWIIIAIISVVIHIRQGEEKRLLTKILWMALLILITYVVGFLDYQGAGDYDQYARWYTAINGMSFAGVANSSYFGLFRGFSFCYLMWIIGRVITDFRFFFAFCVAICSWLQLSTCKYYKFNPGVYYIAFFSLYGIGQFAIMRQMIAMAVIFWGSRFLVEGQHIKWIIMIIIAASFHPSAIIFLFGFIIKKIPISNSGTVVWLAISSTILLFLRVCHDFVVNLWREGAYLLIEGYTQGRKGVYLALAIAIADIICLLLFSRKHKFIDQELQLFLNFMALGMTMQIASVSNYMLVRIAYYFNQFTPVAWFRIARLFKKKQRIAIYALMFALAFSMYYVRCRQYPSFSLVY